MPRRDELLIQLQQAISAVSKRSMYGYSTRGFLGLLQECMTCIVTQQKKIDRYEAERDTPQYQSGHVYHSLIRNQAYKIRMQKERIKTLDWMFKHERSHARLLQDLVRKLQQERRPMEEHYREIKKAANRGDVIRILALLDRWGENE